MPLSAGTRLGPYEITALIGAGGMGEVYRSRDTKLKRDVAIKILPPEFSQDPERMQRFRREAEVLATLNHPCIAHIYGFEEAGQTPCLVLELAAGETLTERLQHQRLSVEDALHVATQIAEALESAHERGIVHRDLKPANIKISTEGKVKVLDFGLAKAMETGNVDVNLSQSPTVLSDTMPGVILGTAAYMSPEQAKGLQADARSDIWAFGCVLYEMLAGKPPFHGDTGVEVLGEVLKADADLNALPATIPKGIRSLLKRCLQKDRTKRLHAIADARLQIEDAMEESSVVPETSPRKVRSWFPWAITVATLIASVILMLTPSAETDRVETRLQIATPPGISLTSLAISPDGRKVVFEAMSD